MNNFVPEFHETKLAIVVPVQRTHDGPWQCVWVDDVSHLHKRDLHVFVLVNCSDRFEHGVFDDIVTFTFTRLLV